MICEASRTRHGTKHVIKSIWYSKGTTSKVDIDLAAKRYRELTKELGK
jgi:phage-related protein